MSGPAIHPRKALAVVSFCVALLLATAAQAATAEKKNQLFKCVDAKGVVSIQSAHCPADSTEAWRRDAPPEPPLTPEQAAQAEVKLRRDQQAVRELSALVEKKLQPPPAAPAAAAPEPAEPPTPESLAVDACQSAQAFAASAREKTWLGLTDEQTRRLYGWVADQCRVQTKPSD
jgi:hypothetical protein